MRYSLSAYLVLLIITPESTLLLGTRIQSKLVISESVSDGSLLRNNSDIASIDQECPIWFKRNHDGTCECGETGLPFQLKCEGKTKNTFVSRTFCVTYNANDTVVAGYCPFNFIAPDANKTWLSVLPPLQNFTELNEIMCGPLNRTGLLCGQCQEGLGPAVLSYTNKCIECFDLRYGWLVYLAGALLPTTLLCIIIMVFHIEVTSPAMNSFVLMCQLIINLISIQSSLFLVFPDDTYKWLSLPLMTFYGIWNLDFFRGVLPPFCISPNMNTVQVVALDYVVAIYPLILTAFVYYCIEFHDRGYRVLVFLWKPIHRRFVGFRQTWNLKGSIINAFTTFLFLSYCKLLFISYGLLHQVTVRDNNGVTLNNWALYFDASLTVFHSAHIPYAVLAILVLLFFIILPLLFVLFFQNRFFKSCLSACKLEISLLAELATICQRSYKNGIDGATDYRWFAGAYLIYRIAYCLYYPFNPPVAFILVICMSGLMSLICAMLQPHQTKLFSILDSIFFAIICFTMIYVGFARFAPELNMSMAPISIAFTVPIVYFVCIVTYKITLALKRMTCCLVAVERLSALYKRERRPATQNVGDEFLPYRLTHSSESTPLQSPVGEEFTVTTINVDIDELETDSPDEY